MSKTYALYPFIPKHEPKLKALVTIVCDGCHQPFVVERWKLRKGRRFCSNKCKFGNPLDRLMKHVVKQDNGCWNWKGWINKTTGYGQIKAFGRNIGPHQLSFLLHKGAIPDGCGVLHTCIGNRLCVNPDHLYAGTPKENVGDMIDQGRFRIAIGQESGRSKLTNEQAQFILDNKGVMKAKVLAAMFHVVQPCISLIWTRKNWKHLIPVDNSPEKAKIAVN